MDFPLARVSFKVDQYLIVDINSRSVFIAVSKGGSLWEATHFKAF